VTSSVGGGGDGDGGGGDADGGGDGGGVDGGGGSAGGEVEGKVEVLVTLCCERCYMPAVGSAFVSLCVSSTS